MAFAPGVIVTREHAFATRNRQGVMEAQQVIQISPGAEYGGIHGRRFACTAIITIMLKRFYQMMAIKAFEVHDGNERAVVVFAKSGVAARHEALQFWAQHKDVILALARVHQAPA